MRIYVLIILFVLPLSAQNTEKQLAEITEIANLTSDDPVAIPITNNEFTNVIGYQTEWMDMDINFGEILKAKIQYCLVFDKENKSFAFYYAYTGRDWSQLDRAIFKFHDSTVVKPLIIGKRKILAVGFMLRQYFSTEWFSLSDFLYQYITTGSLMINFTGLKWNLTTNIIPQTDKIILAKFYLKMLHAN